MHTRNPTKLELRQWVLCANLSTTKKSLLTIKVLKWWLATLPSLWKYWVINCKTVGRTNQ